MRFKLCGTHFLWVSVLILLSAEIAPAADLRSSGAQGSTGGNATRTVGDACGHCGSRRVPRITAGRVHLRRDSFYRRCSQTDDRLAETVFIAFYCGLIPVALMTPAQRTASF